MARDSRRRSSGHSSQVSVKSVPEDKFGFGSCTPSWAQFFNTAVWLLAIMSMANIFQSMLVNGLVGTVITSLEKRFDLTSSESSMIVSSYDISTIPMLILVSYFGSRSHRARWTACGLFILVVGTIIFVLPHFITADYYPNVIGEDDLEICDIETVHNRTCSADTGDRSLRYYLGMFIVGRLFHGLGAVPLYTICVTFMDDCVSKETFSLYIAIFYASGILGPALGYMVGGALLNIYTDWHIDVNLSPDDPQWVGAWWPGFLFGAAILFLIGIPMAGFPRDLPGAAEIRANKESEAYDDGASQGGDVDVETEEEPVGCKELLFLVKGLVMNPTYVFLTFFVCCDSLLTGGFTAFGPKYVESQFSESAAFAGILFGVIVVPGGAGGTVVGGVLVKKLRMSCSTIMKWEVVFTVAMLITGFMFFIVCDPVPFAGVTTSYNITETEDPGRISWQLDSDLHNLNDPCNAGCGCQNITFLPVCGDNQVQYYSPCHAGCQDHDGEGLKYFNCTCIRGNGTDVFLGADRETQCSNSRCKTIPLFMIIIFCAMFLLFACSSMNISATVRCVPAYQRSLAIGIQWIMLRLLGTIPGPVIFGAAFDGACRHWQETCGRRGPCLSYNNTQMGLNMFLICVIVKVVSLVFIVLAWKLYKPPKRQEQDMYGIEDIERHCSVSEDKTANGTRNGRALSGIDSPAFEPDTPEVQTKTQRKASRQHETGM